MDVEEAFLHHIWKRQLFDRHHLRTTENESIEVFKIGWHNFESGPDFSEAIIKINGTIWAGQVEIHVNSSDWYKHKHQFDKAYENVVLHVVYRNDKPVQHASNLKLVPTLELINRIPGHQYRRYQALKSNQQKLACEVLKPNIANLEWEAWWTNMAIERIELKALVAKNIIEKLNAHWEQGLFIMIARAIGMPQNTEAFEHLAHSLPINLLKKHSNHSIDIEALFFGMAGFFELKHEGSYPIALKERFLFLKHKYKLEPMPLHRLKFGKMRPGAFPNRGIAFLSALVLKNCHQWSAVFSMHSLKEIRQWLSVQFAEYWHKHYQFDQVSKRNTRMIGVNVLEKTIINAVIPTKLLWNRQQLNPTNADQNILDLMEGIKAENNKITRNFHGVAFAPENALQSQGQIHLYKNYCLKKKCLDCRIGQQLLS